MSGHGATAARVPGWFTRRGQAEVRGGGQAPRGVEGAPGSDQGCRYWRSRRGTSSGGALDAVGREQLPLGLLEGVTLTVRLPAWSGCCWSSWFCPAQVALGHQVPPKLSRLCRKYRTPGADISTLRPVLEGAGGRLKSALAASACRRCVQGTANRQTLLPCPQGAPMPPWLSGWRRRCTCAGAFDQPRLLRAPSRLRSTC